jgi:hypothetical protein
VGVGHWINGEKKRRCGAIDDTTLYRGIDIFRFTIGFKTKTKKKREIKQRANKKQLLMFSRPPLWHSGQSSGFDSRGYQIFGEVVSLERGPLNLVNLNEELLGRRSRDSGLENQNYGRRDPSR